MQAPATGAAKKGAKSAYNGGSKESRNGGKKEMGNNGGNTERGNKLVSRCRNGGNKERGTKPEGSQSALWAHVQAPAIGTPRTQWAHVQAESVGSCAGARNGGTKKATEDQGQEAQGGDKGPGDKGPAQESGQAPGETPGVGAKAIINDGPKQVLPCSHASMLPCSRVGSTCLVANQVLLVQVLPCSRAPALSPVLPCRSTGAGKALATQKCTQGGCAAHPSLCAYGVKYGDKADGLKMVVDEEGEDDADSVE